MKQTALSLLFTLMAALPLPADDSPSPAVASMPTAGGTNNAGPFNSDRQRASYAIGMMIGHNWQQQGVDVDFDLFTRGFRDVQSGGPTLLTPQEMQDTLKEFQKTVAARQEQKRKELAEKNKKDEADFLAANKKKPGVKVLKDGLQYKILTDGKGARPGTNDMVLINFRGTLLDGTEFDSTAKRGQPAEYALNQINIPGWREALQLMKAGSVWELYIPAALAYGETGRPPQIPGNSMLVFDVQLISSAPPGAVQPALSKSQPLTSDIIAVPSAAELKKGKQPFTLKPEDVQRLQKEMQKTNPPAR